MEPTPAPPSCPLPAVVVNPSRVDDLAQLHAQITRVCVESGWASPLWLETTVEDPGHGQARIALAAGADVVLACGGDGTIRHVAQVLAGSGTALGLLPMGTANLLARNLALTRDDVATATRIALCGNNRAIDVGWMIIDDRAEEQAFLVMAGMGFDAAIMAGGLVLMPAAKLDDGLLDVVAIGPRSIIGWLPVTARVLGRRRRGHRIVQHWQGRTIILSTEAPQQAQVDGDPVGAVRALRMRVDRGALLVRV